MMINAPTRVRRRSDRIKSKLMNLTNIQSNDDDEQGKSTKKRRVICVEKIPPTPPAQQAAVITPVSSLREQRKILRDQIALKRATKAALHRLNVEKQAVILSNKRDREFENSQLIVHECDKIDVAEPRFVTTYIEELYSYYKHIERTRATSLYMHIQQDINARMRAILIDWLVEVHLKFKLAPETLFLCVALIDRYLCQNSVPRSKLQLVGVAGMLMACKYEETHCPSVRDCSFITDRAFSEDEIRITEIKMLYHFEFSVTSSSPNHFLTRFIRIAQYSFESKTAHRAQYFVERCLQEHSMLAYRPSLIAAAAVYLAAMMESPYPWSQALETYSGYVEDQVLCCARPMSHHVNTHSVTASQRSLHAVRKKFQMAKFLGVSDQPPPYL